MKTGNISTLLSLCVCMYKKCGGVSWKEAYEIGSLKFLLGVPAWGITASSWLDSPAEVSDSALAKLH